MAVPLVITAERQKLLFLTSYLNQITNSELEILQTHLWIVKSEETPPKIWFSLLVNEFRSSYEFEVTLFAYLVLFNLFVNAFHTPAKLLLENFWQTALALHTNFQMEEIDSKLGIVFYVIEGWISSVLNIAKSDKGPSQLFGLHGITCDYCYLLMNW